MIIRQSNSAQSVKEYYFSKKLTEIKRLQNSGTEILNLGIGNPDLPPPDEAIDELQNSIQQNSNHGYQSYKGTDELRRAFSDWYKAYFEVDLDANKQILPLMGSKAGIMHISTAFLNQGDKVLVPDPGYPAYKSAAMINGAKPIAYDLTEKNSYFPNLKELEKLDLFDIKLMWVNYPNMPTGQKASLQQFRDLINFGRRHKILIINDNPYSFILNNEHLSLLKVEHALETALELNSLSKSHNMAGWRIGALFGREDYINTVQKIQSNLTSGMLLPLQKAAEKALRVNGNWYKDLNKIYKERQQKVYQLLKKINCAYNENSSGMFIWAKIPEDFTDSYFFSEHILNTYNIFITPGAVFGTNGNKYIRVSLCSTNEIYDKALRRLTKRISSQNE